MLVITEFIGINFVFIKNPRRRQGSGGVKSAICFSEKTRRANKIYIDG